MTYKVHIVAAAERELDRLSEAVYDRIYPRMVELEDNPRPRGGKKLRGREEYRLRVGDYRVLYMIDDRSSTVTVLAVGHRREVYR